MNREEFGKRLAALIKERDEKHARDVAALFARIDQLKAQLDAIPPARDGRDGLPGVPGPPGEPGRDGKDAVVKVDDIPVQYDGERTITLLGKTIRLPVMIYRGVYQAGLQYDADDAVTWAGSVWRCKSKTTERPGTDDWQLIVKAGRDGRDAKGAAYATQA